jgi:hypothetical protein
MCLEESYKDQILITQIAVDPPAKHTVHEVRKSQMHSPLRVRLGSVRCNDLATQYNLVLRHSSTTRSSSF